MFLLYPLKVLTLGAAVLFMATPLWADCAGTLEELSPTGRWTRESLLAALRHLHSKGFDLSAQHISVNRTQRIRTELARFVSRRSSQTGGSLYQKLLDEFETYDAALRAAGLDPRVLYKQNRFGSQSEALRLLAFLAQKGVSVRWSSLRDDQSAKTSRLIHQFLGLSKEAPTLTGRQLARHLIHRVSDDQSWSAVLRAVNREVIDYHYWSKTNVAGALAALSKAGRSLNASVLVGPPDRETNQIIASILNRPVEPLMASRLYRAALRHYGSWPKALEAAGVDVNETILWSSYWSQSLVKEILVKLHRAGIPLNAIALIETRDHKTNQLIADELKLPADATMARRLFTAGVRHFGSWEQALREAGLNSDEIVLYAPYWSKDLVKAAVLKLYQAGRPLNASAVAEARDIETNKLIAAVLKQPVDSMMALRLYSAGVRYYGSWTHALKAAGLNADNIVKWKPFWTKALVVTAIQRLHKEDRALNATAMVASDDPRTHEIIADVLGKPVDPMMASRLLGAALRRYGSWWNALRAAGLNVDEIVLWMPAASRRVLAPSQKESIVNPEGEIEIVRYMGRDRRDRSQDPEHKELQVLIVETAANLSERERIILREILDFLELSDGIPSKEAMAEETSRRLGFKVQTKEIDRIFEEISKRPEFEAFR